MRDYVYLFIYFWLHWVFATVRGLPIAGGLLCCRARVPGTWALECRLSSCGARAQFLHSMWDPPRPGLESAFPRTGRWIPNQCTTRKAHTKHFSVIRSLAYGPKSSLQGLSLKDLHRFLLAYRDNESKDLAFLVSSVRGRHLNLTLQSISHSVGGAAPLEEIRKALGRRNECWVTRW